MTDEELLTLVKLSAIGGPHHERYAAEAKKFRECKHRNIQQFTEYCLDCGYNVWYGVDPKPFLNAAMRNES